MMGQPAVILDWYGCDLRSGLIVEELRALTPDQPLSRRLGVSTACSLRLPLAGAPRAWEAATTPGRTMLVAVDRLTDQPLTAYMVLTREGGAAPDLVLGGATPEAYLDRRYTGTYLGVQQDQAAILTGTGAAILTDAPPFVLDAPPTGILQDFSVEDGDDRTILSVWQELMAAEGGPEWTVDVAWNATRSGFVLPVRVRPAIGVQSVSPEAVFDFPGCVSSYTLAESYTAGTGATVVIARGEGEGDSRLTSSVHTADTLIAGGWARWVYRYTPAAGGTDPVQLDAHAAAALGLMQTGGVVWTVTATASRAPRLGRDWALGDSVRVQVARSPRHPGGAETVARAWAWELDPGADTVTPILVQEEGDS